MQRHLPLPELLIQRYELNVLTSYRLKKNIYPIYPSQRPLYARTCGFSVGRRVKGVSRCEPESAHESVTSRAHII